MVVLFGILRKSVSTDPNNPIQVPKANAADPPGPYFVKVFLRIRTGDIAVRRVDVVNIVSGLWILST